jgi:hypothetical protein
VRSEGVELRVVVPRDQLPSVAPAELFSQANCHQLLGIPPRKFLELLRRDGAPRAQKLGKLRLVRRDEMLAFLDRLRDIDARAETPTVLDEADALLVEMGYSPKRRKAG